MGIKEEMNIDVKHKRKPKKSVETENAPMKVTVPVEEEKIEMKEEVIEIDKATVKKPSKKKTSHRVEDVEEVEDSFHIKPEKLEPVAVADLTSDATFEIPKEPETEIEQENTEEEFQIGLKSKPKPKTSASEDVEEEMRIGVKPKRKPKKPLETEKASLKVTVPVEEEKIEIKEEVIELDKATVKKPSKKKTSYRVEDVEEVEDSFHIKPEKQEPVAVADIASNATFEIPKEPETKIEQEDIEEEFQIGLKPKSKPIVSAPEDVEEEMRFGLKPKRKPKKSVETENASLKVIVPVEEEKIEIKEEVIEIDKATVKKPSKKKTSY